MLAGPTPHSAGWRKPERELAQLERLDTRDGRAYRVYCAIYIAKAAGDAVSLRRIAVNNPQRNPKGTLWFPEGVFWSATDLGEIYQLLGDYDSAFHWYERAYDLGQYNIARFGPLNNEFGIPATIEPFSDPRWKALRNRPEIRLWEATRAKILRDVANGIKVQNAG